MWSFVSGFLGFEVSGCLNLENQSISCCVAKCYELGPVSHHCSLHPLSSYHMSVYPVSAVNLNLVEAADSVA
jgi:hypothetical protein